MTTVVRLNSFNIQKDRIAVLEKSRYIDQIN
jgi:hypothetical protein